jgi:ABC-2 type transport system permease protein
MNRALWKRAFLESRMMLIASSALLFFFHFSGELGRGTMEMVLAQPVRRISVLFVQAAVTTLGAVLLGVFAWFGTCAGLATVTLPGGAEVARSLYLPAAWNLTALAFFLAGVTTLLSSCDRYRWRPIGLAAGFYVVSLIMKLTARMAPDWEWLMYGSFLRFFEPLLFINRPDDGFWLGVEYNGPFMALGLAAYVIAAVIFCHRDIPAPI